jgi:Nif-specific regulatory protein
MNDTITSVGGRAPPGQNRRSFPKNLSRGIIAEAMATGQIIDTPSAMLDERFSSRQSVRMAQIQAVLCVPIEGDPSIGVLYLQGRDERGPFTAEDRACSQIFARHFGPLGTNLLLRSRLTDRADHTRKFRETYKLEGIVGRSPALAALLREVALVIPLDVNVLLLGESGTGKSQLAHVIHENGPRAAQPFVEVNSAALPEGLVESELFGARSGSHSTADRHIPGKVAAAEHGTLFLDEVGALSQVAQGKLLQLLQSKIYYPLGATEPSTADIRLIAATNTDLETAVAQGHFREDLFYRLQVLPIRVPSLAERRSDIAELVQHFRDMA